MPDFHCCGERSRSRSASRPVRPCGLGGRCGGLRHNRRLGQTCRVGFAHHNPSSVGGQSPPYMLTVAFCTRKATLAELGDSPHRRLAVPAATSSAASALGGSACSATRCEPILPPHFGQTRPRTAFTNLVCGRRFMMVFPDLGGMPQSTRDRPKRQWGVRKTRGRATAVLRFAGPVQAGLFA